MGGDVQIRSGAHSLLHLGGPAFDRYVVSLRLSFFVVAMGVGRVDQARRPIARHEHHGLQAIPRGGAEVAITDAASCSARRRTSRRIRSPQ